MSWSRYLLRRIVREGVCGARGLAYLGVCVAALVAFAVLMPALEYQHVRATEVSQWDVWVSGPLSETDLAALGERTGVSRVIPALSLGIDSVSGPGTDPERIHAAGSVTAIAYRSAAEVGSGAYPKDLLIAGAVPQSGEVACDWNTARRFDLSVGDEVVVRATPLGGDFEYRGRLAGIYGPTGIVKDSIAIPATGDVEEIVGDAGQPPWTDAFITTSEPAMLVGAVLQGPDAERLLAVERDALAHEARSRLYREVGPFFRNTASWVAVAGFASLALWQQSTRISRRRAEYAVLSALGMDSGRLVGLDAVEQATRLAVSAGLGIAVAVLLVQDFNGLFVPRGALLAAVGAVVATVVVTLTAGALSIRRRLRSERLSRVLAREVPR